MKIIACDFDNTLSLRAVFPNVGEPNKKLFEYLIDCQKNGDTVILWTCRCGDALDLAVKFCEVNGLIQDYVNRNATEKIAEFGNDSRKVFANLYIDDCAKTPWEIIDYQPKEKPVRECKKMRIVR